jgi:hypothetical protein
VHAVPVALELFDSDWTPVPKEINNATQTAKDRFPKAKKA